MNWLYVFVLSILPISEIRGAMIYGVGHNMNLLLLYALSVIGNMLPVFLILWMFKSIMNRLRGISVFRVFIDWLENRVQKKARSFGKKGAWALFVLVSIPLPTTGAWTASMIAALFDMKYALLSIFLGVCVSGIITLSVCGILNFATQSGVF